MQSARWSEGAGRARTLPSGKAAGAGCSHSHRDERTCLFSSGALTFPAPGFYNLIMPGSNYSLLAPLDLSLSARCPVVLPVVCAWQHYPLVWIPGRSTPRPPALPPSSPLALAYTPTIKVFTTLACYPITCSVNSLKEGGLKTLGV